MADTDKGLTEEERLVRAMEKRANLAFDQKRKEALAKYKGTGHATSFSLNADEDPNAAVKRQVARQHSIEPAPQSPHSAHDHSAQDAAKKAQELAQRGVVHTGLENSTGGLSKYMQDQERQEREFRDKHAEEDARKKAELANFGSGLSAYQEQADARDRELKRRLEEEEARKQEEMKSYGSNLQKYEEAAAKRDRELKQRLEEEDRRRKEEVCI